MRRWILVLVGIGCGGAPPVQRAPVTVAPVPPVCIAAADEPQGLAEDVDGDGIPDLIAKGYRDVTVYLRRGSCLSRLAAFETEGPAAFVNVVSKTGVGIRDLSIDTWLFHGDRRRTLWSWDGRGYRAGFDEEIPGPRRP